MKSKDVLVLAVLLYLLWPRQTTSTEVIITSPEPGMEPLQQCPGGWTVPVNQPCPPYTTNGIPYGIICPDGTPVRTGEPCPS